MPGPFSSEFDPLEADETLDAAEPRPGSIPDDLARQLRTRALRRDVIERRRVAHRLREALVQDGLVQHYQPQVHLQSGKIKGAEAVVRLQHRRRGLILPHHFMPAAERSDIINDLGGWMLTQACQAAATWPADVHVSIRLAHRQLQSGRLVKQLIEALAHAGLASDRLELGLTEPMLIDDNDDTSFNLKAIRGLGVRMALDGFGSGYASLSALRRLPLTTLKLDRSLTQGAAEDDGSTAILHAAIEAGHALGCRILADGADTLEQCMFLQEIGCDDVQGAHYGLPVPADEFLLRLNQP
jgi:EAL domain-containing protein (putative c-di-GMP-specific phosphodiesterase class I)